MKNYSKESPIVEHQEEAHPGQLLQMEVKVIKKKDRTLEKKVKEGTLIAQHTSGTLKQERRVGGRTQHQSLASFVKKTQTKGMRRRGKKKKREKRKRLSWKK